MSSQSVGVEGSKHLCMHERRKCREGISPSHAHISFAGIPPHAHPSRRERAEQVQRHDKSSLHFSRAGWPPTRIPSRANWRVRYGAMPGTAGPLAQSLTNLFTRAGEEGRAEMDLQLDNHASRPSLPVVRGACLAPAAGGFEATCFSSPDSINKGVCSPGFLPFPAYSLGSMRRNCLGARFHQSCLGRNAGMGAVKRGVDSAGHIVALRSENSSASATRRGTRRNRRCAQVLSGCICKLQLR